MYVRRLPSKKWQATVRLPDGRRRTRTFVLKSEATQWGTTQEQRIRRGEWVDPKLARVNYEQWRDRWQAARVVEEHTRQGDLSQFKHHIDPHWTGRALSSITRMDVQGWVRQMEKDGVGAHAIRRSYNLFVAMMGAAVLEGILQTSPCRKIDLPATPPKHPDWFTPEQASDIINALPERHATAAALMFYTGLRWGEMAGLRIGDVDWMRRRVRVVGARTQAGEWKSYPKSSKSRREVPVPEWVMDLLRVEVRDRGGDEPLFVTKRGGRPWSASNWRKVWDEAVKAAGAPPFPPHTCRHSCASWLVQAGVDLYRVQHLLGHEDYRTTSRYAHLAPDAHDAVEQVWARVMPLAERPALVAAGE